MKNLEEPYWCVNQITFQMHNSKKLVKIQCPAQQPIFSRISTGLKNFLADIRISWIYAKS